MAWRDAVASRVERIESRDWIEEVNVIVVHADGQEQVFP